MTNPTVYRRKIEELQHLTIVRLDVSYIVSKLSQFLQSPIEIH